MRNVKTDPEKPERKRLHTARYIDEAAAAGRPVTLRIDDREPLVIQDEAGYQKLWELVDDLETREAVRRGIEEAERGEGIPFDEAMARIRRRFGLTDES